MFKGLCAFMSFSVFLFMWTSTSSAQIAKRLVIEELESELEGEMRRGERWGLIIGVNVYEDPEVNPLRYAVADAKALHAVLVDEDRGRFSPDKVRLLTSDAEDKKHRPTKANILHALNEWLARNVKKQDTVVIFFSGHGFVDGERKYLLPVDTDTSYVPAYAIDNREFIDGIDRLEADKIITLLDSCHSGGVSRSGKSIGGVLGDDFYAQYESAKGRVTLASCSGNEQSLEWPEKGHGVFSYYLLEGLKGAANHQRDQAITFNEVAGYVSENVQIWAAENKNGRQNPLVQMENASVFSQIALTFDLASGFELLSTQWKEKCYGYIGSGPGQLSGAEITELERVLDKISSKLKQDIQPSRDEENALVVILNVIKGEMSIRLYKSVGRRSIQDALREDGYATHDDRFDGEGESLSGRQSGTGILLVGTKPIGTEIHIDGKLIGYAPKVVNDLSAGEHKVRLVLDGDVYEVAVTIKPDFRTKLNHTW